MNNCCNMWATILTIDCKKLAGWQSTGEKGATVTIHTTNMSKCGNT